MVLAQTDPTPRKRKASPVESPTRRQDTCLVENTIEQWLETVPSASDEKSIRIKPAKSETRKRLKAQPRTQWQEQTQDTSDPRWSVSGTRRSRKSDSKTVQVQKRPEVDASFYPLTQDALEELEFMNSSQIDKNNSMSQSVSGHQSEASLGPTDPDYESQLRARKIYTGRNTIYPGNLEEVKAALAATRASPGPDNITAESFPRRVRKTGNESGAMQALLPKLLPIIDRYWDSENDALSLNRQWDRHNLPEQDIRPFLKPPKPDQAFGFTPQTFPFPQASLCLKSAMCPTRDLAWPYCTIEIKGRQGQLDVARLQNSLNGAVMMNNMLELKSMLGKVDEVLGQIIVVTMELTTESISLCGQVTTRNTAGELERDSVPLFVASALDPTGDAFKKSYQHSMNMIETFRARTLRWLKEDMAALEDRLTAQMRRGLSHMTPPSSHQDRDRSPKRRGSRGSSRGTARSLTRQRSNLMDVLQPSGDEQSQSGPQQNQ
jgi:hypothetical protein